MKTCKATDSGMAKSHNKNKQLQISDFEAKIGVDPKQLNFNPKMELLIKNIYSLQFPVSKIGSFAHHL